MSVLVKLDLPGNIVLVRVKFSLTQIPRVDIGIAHTDSQANFMNKVQTNEILQQR